MKHIMKKTVYTAGISAAVAAAALGLGGCGPEHRCRTR